MDNVIIKFAHVLQTADDEDHGVKFVGIFKGFYSLLHSQEIAGVNQCDLQTIQASVICRGQYLHLFKNL